MSEAETLRRLRKEIFLTSYAAGSGHLSPSYSCLEILYALYLRGVLRCTPETVSDPARDKFVMSKGHGSLALYHVLAEAGFFPKEELQRFSRPDGILGGEPKRGDIPGVEATTGSLGHGLSVAVGMALADKLDGREARTFVLVGDGEAQEGSIWEAAMTASRYALSNLTVILDANGLQKMDTVAHTIGDADWAAKWKAFGWDVIEVDGHDVEALVETLSAENTAERPRLILAHTVKGHGVPTMENNLSWHWRQPNKKELRRIAEELSITEEELSHAKGLH